MTCPDHLFPPGDPVDDIATNRALGLYKDALTGFWNTAHKQAVAMTNGRYPKGRDGRGLDALSVEAGRVEALRDFLFAFNQNVAEELPVFDPNEVRDLARQGAVEEFRESLNPELAQEEVPPVYCTPCAAHECEAEGCPRTRSGFPEPTPTATPNPHAENFHAAVERIEGLPPSERSAIANRPSRTTTPRGGSDA